MVEISKDKNRAILYLKSFSLTSEIQVIEAVKISDVREPKTYSIKAYDYHEPGKNLLYH